MTDLPLDRLKIYRAEWLKLEKNAIDHVFEDVFLSNHVAAKWLSHVKGAFLIISRDIWVRGCDLVLARSLYRQFSLFPLAVTSETGDVNACNAR